MEQYMKKKTISIYKLNANDFVFGKLLGEGSFSSVYLTKDVRSGKRCAIKVCEKHLIIRENKQEYVCREREALNKLSGCPGFLSLYCTFQDSRKLYFVMSYARNGTLLQHLSNPAFNVDCTRFYAAEILLALEVMHQKLIIHRDLKPENILLDDKMHIMIADFGSSKLGPPADVDDVGGAAEKSEDECEKDDSDPEKPFGRSRQPKRSFVGTAQYVSPEILTGKPSNPSSDLWSYGCTVYQMICGMPPFRAATEYLIFQKVLSCDLPFSEDFDSEAKDLVTKLLQIEQSKRLGACDSERYTSIRKHPFFREIDFAALRCSSSPLCHADEPTVLPNDEECFDDDLRPGLDSNQAARLHLLPYEPDGVSIHCEEPEHEEKKPQQLVVWERFSEGEEIIKYGYIHKKKGLFARRRMLLLTTGPKLIYIDPVAMVKKGEIPWSQELRTEAKNFKSFLVHTPNRTYYLEDAEGFALHWCNAIDEMHRQTFLNDSAS